MAGKLSKQDQLHDLHNTLKIAENLTETQLSSAWKMTLANYRGHAYRTGAKINEVSMPLNIVRALSDVVVPAVYFRDPAIRIRPTIPNTEKLCQFRESRTNYLLKRNKFKKQARKVTLDAYLFGIGHFKVGYETRIEHNYEPMINEETGQVETTADGLPILLDAAGNVYVEEQSGRVRMVATKDGHGVQPNEREYPLINQYVEREFPYAQRWSPWDVLKDPMSLQTDGSDAQWIAFRSSMHIDNVRDHPVWSNTSGVEPTQEPDYVRSIRDRHLLEPLQDASRVQVYEVYCREWDKHTKSWRTYMKVVAEGYNKWLFYEPTPLKVRGGFPLVSLSFVDNPESGMPLSPVETVRPQIDGINIMRTMVANHLQRFHQKYLYNPNVVTAREAQRFATGGIGSVLPVRVDEDMDVQKAFRTAEVPPIDMSQIQEIQSLWGDIMKGTGINEHHLGSGGIARQATQASYIESALGVRLNMKQDLLADAIIQVTEMWADLDRQYGDYEATYQTTGVDEATWQTFKVGEAVPDDFDTAADMQVAAFQAIEAEKEEMFQLANLVVNIPGMNLNPVMERLFKAFGFPTPELMYTQPPPQMMGPDGKPLPPSQSASSGAVDPNSANAYLNQDANVNSKQGVKQ